MNLILALLIFSGLCLVLTVFLTLTFVNLRKAKRYRGGLQFNDCTFEPSRGQMHVLNSPEPKRVSEHTWDPYPFEIPEIGFRGTRYRCDECPKHIAENAQ